MSSIAHHCDQARYLLCYLDDLGATFVLEEPIYFDRDYLAEFSAFYSSSASRYPNTCRRLHFFKGPVDRGRLTRAIGGNERVRKLLEENYLGFAVIRPIPAAPLGRTVVIWYPDQQPSSPRITEPSRVYTVHLAGMPLRVRGLAWQQQDRAVSACATVALWTVLHSSAFDDHHAVPTTAWITGQANAKGAMGSRVFPSSGLNQHRDRLTWTATSGAETVSGSRLGP